MTKFLKDLVKRSLGYEPLADTAKPRQFIKMVRQPGLPYCPDPEGDLLHGLITQHGCNRCLEIGFATGSTAIYMLNALASKGGTLISIDIPTGHMNQTGLSNLKKAEMTDRHRLILENSVTAIPRLFMDGMKFDLIFLDGWKTFDHMAVELFFLTRMLILNGFLVFDDANMPSVYKIIKLMQRYYGYHEIDYARYDQTGRLRLFQILTTRTLRRPYRAIRKVKNEIDLPVTQDWNFFADF